MSIKGENLNEKLADKKTVQPVDEKKLAWIQKLVAGVKG